MPPAILRLAPYAVAGGGILLGWRFNRSKLVFAIFALFTVERLLTLPIPALVPAHPLIIKAAAILLPLNLAYYTLMTERGFLTKRGIIRLILFGFQPFLVVALHHWQPAKLQQWLKMPLFNLPFTIPRLSITDPALCSFAISFLLILLVYARRRSALENAFFWATISAFMALTVPFFNNPQAISILLTMAGLILIVGVIETAHTMAFRDELTSLPGRRALEEALLKLGSRYTIAMLDIDFFKKFNDTYGHDVGDQVLRMVASKMAQPGGGGKAFRYGGEEFTILFNGKDAEEAVPHLERLRKTIEASGFSLRGDKRAKQNKKKRGKNNGRKVSVTISIGAANRQANGPADPQAVIKAADKALYKAKDGGRNQVATV
ncbi:MAG: GGDEF domain-containing protein [Desulfobulbaceae bacterium]|nr:GGDEF domain-containing protein [Desulfobulbaceae bacterium]